MSLSTKLLLIVPIICILLLIVLISVNIYNKLTKNSLKEYFCVKYKVALILSLSVLSIISSTIFINKALDEILKETIFQETSPNKKFDIQIQSSTAFDFGSGIIVYVKDNSSKDSKLEELLKYNISQDLVKVQNGDVNMLWNNNSANLIIDGEAEVLYIDIWIDSITNEFKYKLKSIKK